MKYPTKFAQTPKYPYFHTSNKTKQTKKWKVLSEKDVLPSKWFPMKHHTVELASGVVVDDYFISPLGDVAMVIENGSFFPRYEYSLLLKNSAKNYFSKNESCFLQIYFD